MSIAENDIVHIARLSKLELNARETEEISKKLAGVLDYMQQLNQLDTSGVPATYHAVEDMDSQREDIVEPGLPIDKALHNAPEHDERNFIVPKIL